MSTRVFTTFNLDDQLFGLDIHFVREINRHLDLSPVPHAPQYIRGLINLRGQIVTVMDLKRRLGFESSGLTEQTHNLIIKTNAERGHYEEEEEDCLIPDKLGLLVDDIGDIVSVESDQILPPPANAGKIDGAYVTGVVRLKDSLLTILSMPCILKGAN